MNSIYIKQLCCDNNDNNTIIQTGTIPIRRGMFQGNSPGLFHWLNLSNYGFSLKHDSKKLTKVNFELEQMLIVIQTILPNSFG